MAVQVKTADVRDEILEHLTKIERNLSWLSKKAGYNYNTMYSTFVQKVIELSEEKLSVINALLDTDFKK